MLPTTPSISITLARPATPASALHFWPGFVDIDIPPSKLSAIERRDCFLTLFGVRHFYESEASRTTRITICHDGNPIYRAVWAKQLPQIVFPGVEIEIPYKDVLHKIYALRELFECRCQNGGSDAIPGVASQQDGKHFKCAGSIALLLENAFQAHYKIAADNSACHLVHHWHSCLASPQHSVKLAAHLSLPLSGRV